MSSICKKGIGCSSGCRLSIKEHTYAEALSYERYFGEVFQTENNCRGYSF